MSEVFRQGERIEDYYTLESDHLEVGSFSTVYRAKQNDSGDEVAVKVIKKAIMEGDLSRCLENEVMLLANIDHPNIVNLLEVFEDDENVYII